MRVGSLQALRWARRSGASPRWCACPLGLAVTVPQAYALVGVAGMLASVCQARIPAAALEADLSCCPSRSPAVSREGRHCATLSGSYASATASPAQRVQAVSPG